MLSKQEFIAFLDTIKTYQAINRDFSNKLEILLGKNDNYIFGAESYRDYQDTLIELLKYLMDDKENWIDYWIYDCDFGENNKKIIKEPGNPVVEIVTVHTIYDKLTKINN